MTDDIITVYRACVVLKRGLLEKMDKRKIEAFEVCMVTT